jgi:sensor histidine kinase YesM
MLMNYVEIVQMRFEDRLRFDLDVHPDTAEALVPGFFLQPLVENAVRHGIAQNYEGGTIRLKVFKQRQALIIRISDNGPGFSGGREELLAKGFGLSNLQKRLELLYPGEYRLDLLKEEGGGALVVVEIPFRVKQQGPR